MKIIWLYIVIAIILLLLITGVVVANKILNMITRPVKYDVEYVRSRDINNGFSDAITAYEQKWNRQSFSLKCNNIVLSGEVINAPDDTGDRKRVIIICHGHTVNRYASIKYADIFYRLGFNIIIYDERYFGNSGGFYCTLGQEEAKDLLGVIGFARERFGMDCILGLQGESMGAATVLLSLAEEKPDFAIADCSFADSRKLFEEILSRDFHLPAKLLLPIVNWLGMIKYNYRFREVSPIRVVEQTQVPVCLMHGTADTLIFSEHSKRMAETFKNSKSEIHLFPNADHAGSVVTDPQRYEQIIGKFVNVCIEKE